MLDVLLEQYKLLNVQFMEAVVDFYTANEKFSKGFYAGHFKKVSAGAKKTSRIQRQMLAIGKKMVHIQREIDAEFHKQQKELHRLNKHRHTPPPRRSKNGTKNNRTITS